MAKQQNINVLFLARWYPHRYDPMLGLFVHRHAVAASRFCKVGAVYTHVDTVKTIKGFEVDFQKEDGVPVVRVYYNRGLNPVSKMIRFWKANQIGIDRLKQEVGGFSLIHVHVLTRLGLIALYYKFTKSIPYVITEHWSRYLDLTNGFNGLARKWLTRLVVKNAEFVTTVTQNMKSAMLKHRLYNNHYFLLNNVVAEPFLTTNPLSEKPEGKKRLLHVSCFEDASKNVSGIINVLSRLKERDDFEFHFIGDGMDYNKMIELANSLKLDKERIKFLGLMDSREIAGEMAKADLLVMFSNYENFPVVINEAFCMGLPVLTTNVGGIPEKVNSSNGILIEPKDEKALEDSIRNFLNKTITFDNEVLTKKSRKEFSAQTIGEELYNRYQSVLKRKSSH